MVYDLIEFGGFVFWTVVVAGIVVTVLALQGRHSGERLGSAVALTVLFGGALYAFSDFPEINWRSAGLAVAAYLVIGLAWASTRWFLFLKKIRDFVKENSHLSRSELTSKLAYDFDTRRFPPAPSEHSGRLWFWSMFWPLDALCETLTGPLNWIYDRFVLVFSSISKRMFAGVELPEEEPRR